MKINYKSYRIRLALLCLAMVLIGWELHVFKMWTADIYHKAKVCESTQCINIAATAKIISQSEDNFRKEPVTPPKINKGERK